eukprot:3147705-Pyramimonas_sp.AAC.1
MKARVSDAKIRCPSQPPDPATDGAPALADGNIRAGQPRRTSPGGASAAASKQTRHVSPVRAPLPMSVIPPQNLLRHSLGGTTQIKEPDTARIPQLPGIIQLQERQQMVRDNLASASGRSAKACAVLCVAEQPGTTLEDLQDSSDFESIDCTLAAGQSAVLNTEL